MPAPPSPKNHLFLSYAHVDNEPLVTGQAGWVQNFQYSLRVRLKQLLGSEPDIFWDRATIRGNDVLSAVIDTDLVTVFGSRADCTCRACRRRRRA